MRETSTTSGMAINAAVSTSRAPSPNPTSRAAKEQPTPSVRTPPGNPSSTDRGQPGDDAHRNAAPVGGSLLDGYNGLLLILSASLDDMEGARIATGNRLFAFEEKGMKGTPEAERLRRTVKTLLALEEEATKDLERAMKNHPYAPWVASAKGIGLKQAARLLAALGNVAARPNLGKLRQYAGHGDPKRSHVRKENVRIEMDVEGGEHVYLPFSPTAKMRTRMVAKSCIVQRCKPCAARARAEKLRIQSETGKALNDIKLPWTAPASDCTCAQSHPYRHVYDRERMKWADRDTSDGHKDNHALRVVGKKILKGLWRWAHQTSV